MVEQIVLASVAWMLTIGVCAELVRLGILIWQNSQTRRRIPCDRCIYATQSPQLNQIKCTVHPGLAYSAGAIACLDWQSLG